MLHLHDSSKFNVFELMLKTDKVVQNTWYDGW